MNCARQFAALIAASLGLGAQAGQYTDLWWNPQQSGWGMNVVQQLETAFVTLFVYGPDGKPTWYVAPQTRVFAYAVPGGLPQFSGPLYRTQGPWHGGSFDPAAVQATAVGSLSLEVLAKDRIRVHYDAEGVSVTRDVVRQTWDAPLLAANYHATFSLRQALPGQFPIGTLQYTADVLAHLDGGAGFLRIEDHLGRRCEYRGTHVQSGKLATITGAFECVIVTGTMQPTSGTFELTDLEVSDHGITGYLRTYSPGLNEYGRFAAALY